MTIREAIRILDPETSRSALGEIEYYGGLRGREKMIAACDEACRVACQVMRAEVARAEQSRRMASAAMSDIAAALERRHGHDPE